MPTLHSKGHGGCVAPFSSFLLLFHLLCHLLLLLIPSYTFEIPFKRHGVQGHLILLEKERYLWNFKHFSICQSDPINANLELKLQCRHQRGNGSPQSFFFSPLSFLTLETHFKVHWQTGLSCWILRSQPYVNRCDLKRNNSQNSTWRLDGQCTPMDPALGRLSQTPQVWSQTGLQSKIITQSGNAMRLCLKIFRTLVTVVMHSESLVRNTAVTEHVLQHMPKQNK